MLRQSGAAPPLFSIDPQEHAKCSEIRAVTARFAGPTAAPPEAPEGSECPVGPLSAEDEHPYSDEVWADENEPGSTPTADDAPAS